MDQGNSSLAKEIEELLNKSIEANKIFLSESSRIVKQFTTPGEKKTPNIFQGNFLTEAFSAYTKLNIQHMKNMLDLGVSMVKKAGVQTAAEAGIKEDTTGTAEPSFVLKAETVPGGKVSLSFLLDNIKPEEVLCTLVNTPYTLQPDISVTENFITNFSPQSFMLNTGEQKRLNIEINVSENATPGVYISNVQVQGFEPSYFSIILTVNKIADKTPTNGRNAKKRSNQ